MTQCTSSRTYGPQDLGGDARVVGDADRLADVVAQRGDHALVVGARRARRGGGLQAVGELVDREAVGDAAELRSISRTVSATRPWLAKVSLGDDLHCSAVDSSIRVKRPWSLVSHAPILPDVSDRQRERLR